MELISISTDVEIELPSTLTIAPANSARRSRGFDIGGDPITAALASADFTLAADVQLAPTPRRSRRTAPDEETAPMLRVAVSAPESALLLVESDGGVFHWIKPTDEAAGDRRQTGRTLLFSLASSGDSAPDPSEDRVSRTRGPRTRRDAMGWIGDRLFEAVRIRVLKFVVGAALDWTIERLEGNRPWGVVDMRGDAQNWLPDAAALEWPDDRPPRVLLFVHGTFSTTRGSFEALESSPEGRDFLARARASYDLVLGFDHSTLAQTPRENALDIAQSLAVLPNGSVIDAIAYSRGGLVYRELAERVVPKGVIFRRAIFVGCTNAGTHLAEPANWDALADLYTNIVVAGARALALLGAGAAGAAVEISVSAIGRLVKVLSEVAVTDERVPGLAAMQPGSDTIKRLNSGTESLASPSYFVIASNFEPRIEPKKGLTGELAEYLIDRIVDRFFQVDNDLVVDTGSMSDFGSRSGRLAPGGVVIFPAADVVYHTVYFAAPKLALLLTGWLGPQTDDVEFDEDSLGWDETQHAPVYGETIEDTGAAAPLHESFTPAESRTGIRRTRGGAGATPVPLPMPAQPSERRRRGGGAPALSPVIRAQAGVTKARSEPAPANGPEAAQCYHVAAEMNPAPELASPTPLFVTVSRDQIIVAPSATRAATPESAAADPAKPIAIEVIAARNCRLVPGPDDKPGSLDTDGLTTSLTREIVVPERSASLRFALEGTSAGVAEIFVEARQDAHVMASFLLKPVFAGTAGEPLAVSQTARATHLIHDEPAVLRILEMQQDDTLVLRFDLSCQNPNFFIQEDVRLSAGFDLKAFAEQFLKKLEDSYDLENYDASLGRIRDFSIEQTNGLLPKSIRQALWNYKDQIRAIQVISENPEVPWELLYIVDPTQDDPSLGGFLAEWGLVRWMYNANWPSRDLKLRPDRIFHVIPDYLDKRNRLAGAADERKMLESRWPQAHEVNATSDRVRDFLRTGAAACDLLHFACHGQTRQEAVLDSNLVMRGFANGNGAVSEDLLGHSTVKVASRFGSDTPSGMVFLNACQTGRPGAGVARTTGFADAFIRPMSEQGVSVFIGALWSISDTLALTFADIFYERLLLGDTLVEAAQAARTACQDKKDFTWLAYSIYGHPFATVGPPGSEDKHA